MLKWLMLFLYLFMISYILARTIHCLKQIHPLTASCLVLIAFSAVFIGCCSTLLLRGLLPESKLRIVLHKFANYWLGFFIYLILFIVLADLVRLVLWRINQKKMPPFMETGTGNLLTVLLAAFLSIGFTVYGQIHMNKIHTKTYDVTVDKTAGSIKELNVVLISDLHLGYTIGETHMERMVETINAMDPDLVIVAGDITDNEFDAIKDPNRIAEILSGIHTRFGIYAVYGNHDVAETLIGGFPITPKSEAFRDPRVEDFLEACGFQMLEDEAVLIEDSFYVIGRLDGLKAGDGTSNRKSLEELTGELDQSRPLLLVSHEPDRLEENAAAGMDLQLSGHTHDGQFFPFNLTQHLTWKNCHGYLKVDNMHSFVTSGVGIYGPAMRVMTDSEVMQIRIHFK